MTRKARVVLAACTLAVAVVCTVSAQQNYSLEQLTDAALATNPDILQLGSALQADRQELTGARASLYPTVGFQNTYSYIANPTGYTIGKGSLGVIPLPASLGGPVDLPQSDITVPLALYNWNVNFALTVTQPIYLWGKIRSNIALRQTVVAADGLKLTKRQDETRTMVDVNYYTLYYLNRLVALLSEQKQVADDMLKIAEDSYAAGQITDADLTARRMALRAIDHAIVAANGQRESALINLRYLSGLPLSRAEDVGFRAIRTDLSAEPLPSSSALIDRALGKNSDIMLATVSEAVSRNRLDIARSGTIVKPDLSLNLQLAYGGPQLPLLGGSWLSEDNWVANLTLVIGSTLFDGGKSAAAVGSAEAALAQARFQSQSAVRDVSSYIAQTRSDLDTIAENIRYYRSRVADTLEIEKYQKHLLDSGSGSKLDYYQKQVDVFTEQAQVIEQQLAYASRYFTLRNAVGGF
ncbi:MAG TPA: TolC family protein [Spirochaetia bacterium]|nr:TolC family protein [Spirochaetia bacterium]